MVDSRCTLVGLVCEFVTYLPEQETLQPAGTQGKQRCILS